MSMQFKVITNNGDDDEHTYKVLSKEEQFRHFKNVTASVLQDAMNAWGDIWNELQGKVTHGHMITREVEGGFTPDCGWPEFLEKMWILKHHLDYAKRYCEGKE